MIPFNKPYLSGRETEYIAKSVASGKISGDGIFTEKCHTFFEKKYGFRKCLLTTSCTDALEMTAILMDIKAGDEVIVPSYTFVSTANAFALRGAKLIFADSQSTNPNIDALLLESLITENTKAIVIVHYGGVACDMDAIINLTKKYNLLLVEDAAQAIDSFYIHEGGRRQALGSFGDFATFSFHETKNIICGEGGMLVINNPLYVERAEVIREKGTNRSKFFRGEVDKYTWVDLGSSFLPADTVAAFLFAQLENISEIQDRRVHIWNKYQQGFSRLHLGNHLSVPNIPATATNNGHLYYLICKTRDERDELLLYLKNAGIYAVFHYVPLHDSPFAKASGSDQDLTFAPFYSDHLIRLPMFYGLTESEIDFIISSVETFYSVN